MKVVNKIYNSYSLIELIYLTYRVLFTKLLCKHARIIRSGFVLRGRMYIDLGKGLTTGYNCRLEAFRVGDENGYKIRLGNNIQLNDYVHIAAIDSIEIGDNTLIASHVYISDNSHGFYKGKEYDSTPEVPPLRRPYFTSPVIIGKNVWIGEGVIIMPGVQIGDGAVIGAHSIVIKNIPENSIAVGTPARVIKKYNFSSKRWEKVST